MDSAYLVYCTCPNTAIATEIGHALVAQRLAACVNVLPNVISIYAWDNKIEQDEEVLLLIKTTRGAFVALQERIKVIHPYELPEIIAVTIADGLPDYLTWIAEATGL